MTEALPEARLTNRPAAHGSGMAETPEIVR
jgi:hypothetical protein